MDSRNLEFCIVVPTVERPSHMMECLKSVKEQSLPPSEVIIVDDGGGVKENEKTVRDLLGGGMTVTVTTSDGKPSTSNARNTGATKANSEIIVIIDDDVVLGRNYINRLHNIYTKYTQVAGVGGFDPDLRHRTALERIFNRVFLLVSESWKINELGSHGWDPSIKQPVESDWLSGNNASYRRNVLIENEFVHWEGGREPLEDIEMGWRLKRKNKTLMIDPELELRHKEAEGSEGEIEFGIKRGKNRVRIFREHGNNLYSILFVWCMLGEVLRHLLAPLIDGEFQRHVKTGIGMGVGATYQILKPLVSVVSSNTG